MLFAILGSCLLVHPDSLSVFVLSVVILVRNGVEVGVRTIVDLNGEVVMGFVVGQAETLLVLLVYQDLHQDDDEEAMWKKRDVNGVSVFEANNINTWKTGILAHYPTDIEVHA